MKTIIAFITALLGTLGTSAQTKTTDTIISQELTEIVVKAPKVIRKSDMDVYHPSKSAVDNSKNGMQLLRNLMIPTLRCFGFNKCRRTVGAGAN